MKVFPYALFSLITLASAAEPPHLVAPALNRSPTYSWDECVNLAESNNAEVRAAKNNLEASTNQEKGSYAGFFPTISGNLNYSRGGANSSFLGRDSTSPILGISEGYSAGVSASQSIFTGLSTVAQTRQAKANRIAAEVALITAKAQLSYDLKTSFEAMRYAKEFRRLTTEIVKRRDENLRIVTLRFESGRENRGSVLLSEAYRNQSRYDDLQATNALQNSRASLARTLAFDDYPEFDISGEVPVTDPPAGPLDLRAMAEDSPEYQRAAANEEAARAGITIARANFFPTLGVTGGITRDGPSFYPNNAERWSVAATLTFPFFNGGRDYHATKAAIASTKASEEVRVGTARSVLARIQTSYSSFIEGVQRVLVDQSFEKAAQTRAEIGRSKYNNGLLSFEDWDVIENDLIARQKSYLLSKRDRVTAEAAFELVRGKGAIP